MRTNGDGSYVVGADGTLRLTFENSVSFGPVQDGVLYGTRYVEGDPDIAAIALDDGTEQWAVEAKTTGALSLADGTVLTPTRDGVIRLDCGDGSVLWQNDMRVDSAVPVSATVVGGISDGGDHQSFQLDDAGVADDRDLQLFRLDDGELITTFSFGGPTQSPVVTDSGAVFVTGPELLCLETFPESRDD